MYSQLIDVQDIVTAPSW